MSKCNSAGPRKVCLLIEVEAAATARTGVEMEALVGRFGRELDGVRHVQSSRQKYCDRVDTARQ